MASQSDKRSRIPPIVLDADGKMVLKYYKKKQPPPSVKRKDKNRFCPNCGQETSIWVTYFCPRCGEHHDSLYMSERDPKAKMTRAEIEAEYAAVGMAFAPTGYTYHDAIRSLTAENSGRALEGNRRAATTKGSAIRM